MKLSVCIDALFAGRDFIESMRAVRRLGVETAEFWSWWDKDLTAIAAAKDELGMEISAFCTRFISLVDRSRRRDYIYGLIESVEVAQRLDCRQLILLAGKEIPGMPRREQHENLVQGLRECAPIAEQAGITLLVEPLNARVDHPGVYLIHSEEAFQIIDEAGSSNIKVLFDLYHQQVTEGDLISRMRANIDKIGHIHAAGVPGRHELGSGEVDYPNVLRAILQTGYNGGFGLEYMPLQAPEAGIGQALHMINGIRSEGC